MKPFSIFAVLALSACAEAQYADANFSNVPQQTFAYGGKTWIIRDKPEQNRLLVSQTFGDAMGAAMVEGFTWDLSGDMSGPDGAFRAAAVAYLSKHGCSFHDGARVMNENYEAFYTC